MAHAAMMGVSVDESCVGEAAGSMTTSSSATQPPTLGSPKATTQPILCKQPQISQEMDSGIENMDMDEYPASLGVLL